MQLFTNGREFITTLKVLSTHFEPGNDALSREYTALSVPPMWSSPCALQGFLRALRPLDDWVELSDIGRINTYSV